MDSVVIASVCATLAVVGVVVLASLIYLNTRPATGGYHYSPEVAAILKESDRTITLASVMKKRYELSYEEERARLEKEMAELGASLLQKPRPVCDDYERERMSYCVHTFVAWLYDNGYEIAFDDANQGLGQRDSQTIIIDFLNQIDNVG